MKIILTGSTGLIGSRFEQLMNQKYELIPLSTLAGIDITDKNSIEEFLNDKVFDAVLHLAGKTDVDGCELDKVDDLEALGISEGELLSFDVNSKEPYNWAGKKTAVAINTIGTKNLYEVSKKNNAKFIYISSDFVFSGENDYYDETSTPDPVDWYGMSKYLGEKVVSDKEDLVVRLSFPFGFRSNAKKDFVWKLYDLLEEREEVGLIADQTITPTFIDDIVNGIDFLIQKNEIGVINIVGSSHLTPKEVGEKIKKVFGFDTKIKEVELEEVYNGKARRPQNSIMKNDKLKKLGFMPKTFDEGLALIASK